MGKYEIEMEITGFKLKIRGERDEIPVIKENLQQQLSGLLDPATNIAQRQLPSRLIDANPQDFGQPSKPKRIRRARHANGTNGEVVSQALDWNHEPSKFGTPRQSWKAWQKIIWLMHVAGQATGTLELSGPAIAETFNRHFRQAGLLKKPNMPRDLGILKQRAPAFVGDHANKSPITWFLTEEGDKEASKLIIEAKGEPTSEV